MIGRIWTVKELYPPESPPGVVEALKVLRGARDPNSGAAILRRPLTSEERNLLKARRSELTPWVAAARYRDTQIEMLSMFVAFRHECSEDESAAMAMQYSYALAGLPLWAIKRACDAFAQGRVAPEDVGARHIDKSVHPSTAQLHTIAGNLLRPVQFEIKRLDDALHGAPQQKPPTPEERGRIADSIEAARQQFHKQMADGRATEADAEEKARAARDAESRRRNLATLRGEYEAAGLEPPEGEMPASLSMMLYSGWAIAEVDGRNRLVAPAPRTDIPTRTQRSYGT